METQAMRVPYLGCPLCNSTANSLVKVADCSGHPLYKPTLPRELRWLGCEACGHVYVDGYFNEAALGLLFSQTLEVQVPGYDIENQRSTWSHIVDTVSALRQTLGGRWLDVGFGNGSLLTTAAEFGFQVVGLDLREESVKLMRQFGYEAHAIQLAGYRKSRFFDVVSLADVLEHMPFPREALRHAWELLQPEGLLFLSMPNADSFLFQALTYKGVNPYWGEVEHYHNFGRTRLYALLEECGFQPVRYGVSSRYRAGMEVVARKR